MMPPVEVPFNSVRIEKDASGIGRKLTPNEIKVVTGFQRGIVHRIS